MANQRIQYNIVGKYVNDQDARDVVGYHLQSLDGGKSARYSIEQVAFLIGRDQVANCTLQLYKDKVLFRGKGMSLDSLPMQKITVTKPNRVGSRDVVNQPNNDNRNVGNQPNNGGTDANNYRRIKDTCNELALYMAKAFEQRYSLTITKIDKDILKFSSTDLEGMYQKWNMSVFNLVRVGDTGVAHAGIVVRIDNGLNIQESIDQNINKNTVGALLNKVFKQIESYDVPKKAEAKAKSLALKIAEAYKRKYGVGVVSENYDQWMEIKLAGRQVNNSELKITVMVTLDGNNLDQAIVLAYKDGSSRVEDTLDVSSDITSERLKKFINETFRKLDESMNSVELDAISLLRYYNHGFSGELFSIKGLRNRIDNLKAGGNIPDSDAIDLYNRAVGILDKEFFEKAYNTESSKVTIYASDPVDVYINIDGQVGNMYYISTNIWGFDPHTLVDNQREKMIVSKSTMYLLDKMFGDKLLKIGFKGNSKDYKRVHYHDVISRARQFRYIKEFKWLKINYLKINDTVFQGKLRTDLILMGYNYKGKVEGDRLNFASAFQRSDEGIWFNGYYNNIQGKIIGNYMKSTMIHEMCHEYAEEYLGGNYESDRNKWGDILFGIKPWSKDVENQLQCHGEKFGRAVEFAAANCEFTFEQIFGYGIHGSGVAKTAEESYGMYETTKTPYYDVAYSTINGKNKKVQIKEWYDANISTIKNFLQKNIDTNLHNCKAVVENDFSEVTHLSQEDALKKRMIPIRIYIRGNNSTFTEKYKLIFRASTGQDIILKLYRDYEEDYKGYEISSYTIQYTKNNTLVNALKDICSHILADFTDV